MPGPGSLFQQKYGHVKRLEAIQQAVAHAQSSMSDQMEHKAKSGI